MIVVRIPDDAAAAEAWYDARMARYLEWSELAKPLVKRCLAADPASIDLFFLYQDSFFAARQQGIDELSTLLMMAELGDALTANGIAPASVRAVIAPAGDADSMCLRVNLYLGTGGLIASVDRELDPAALADAVIEDIQDALTTLGIAAVEVADGFDTDGKPLSSEAFS